MAHRNPNLVPKGVVNRLGHTTTVYTRPAGIGPERPGLRAAAVPSPTAVPTEPAPEAPRPGTPLPPVPERSDEDLAAFLDSSGTLLPYLVARRSRFLRAPERGAVLLAMDLVTSERLPRGAALYILDAASRADANTSAAHASDMLRVAARIQPTGMSYEWFVGLGAATAGNMRTHGQITTEEKLDSASAVIEYAIAASGWPGARVSNAQRAVLPGGKPIPTSAAPNEHLDELLRARPADVHRIMEYVQERGMHHSDPGPVEELRAWLDEQAAALGPGWL